MTCVRTYRLPRLLCERVPTKEAWNAFLSPFCSDKKVEVEAYSRSEGRLVVRSALGEDSLETADRAVECAYVLFPGRFTLENKEVNGREELLLTDTYRGIVRRYRSGVGKDGKRWELFEVVKP